MSSILDPLYTLLGYGKPVTQASAAEPAPSSPAQPAQSTVAPATSVQPENVPPPSDRPTLTTPADYRLLAILNSYENLGQKTLSFFSTALNAAQTELTHAIEELSAKFKAAAEKARQRGVWTYLQEIATAALAALSGFVGITLIASGGSILMGSALIFSALVSILNMILTKTGGWDKFAEMLAKDNEDLRHALQRFIPLVVGILGSVVGAAGSISTLLSSSLNLGSQALVILQSALGIFQAGTTIGKGNSDAQVIWANADILSAEMKKKLQELALDGLMQGIQGFFDTMNNIHAQARRIISLSSNTNHLSAQHV